MKKRGDITSIKIVFFTTIVLLVLILAIKFILATPSSISYSPLSGSYLIGNSSHRFTIEVNETINATLGNATLYYSSNTTAYIAVNMSCTENSNCTSNTVDLSSFSDKDIIYYYFNFTNNNSQTNQSGSFASPHTLTLDKANGSIALVAPATNTTWVSSATPTLSFTFIDTVSPNASCTVYINDTKYGTNDTVQNNTITAIIINDSLTKNATYFWYVNCSDIVNHTDVSLTQQFLVDTNTPVVNLSIPINNNWTTVTTPNFQFDVTDNTSSNVSCTLYIDGSVDQTAGVNVNTNTTFTASAQTQASHVWNITCTDNAGNKDSTTLRTLYVDNTMPVVSYSTPADNSWTNDNTTSFTFTVTDNVDDNLSCTLAISGTNYGTNSTVANNTATTITLNATGGIADGNYTWNITCTDSAGNSNASDSYELAVDATNPVIALLDPVNNTWSSNVTPNYMFKVTDTMDNTLNCTMYLDGTSIFNNVTTHNDTNMQINSSELLEGQHTWYVVCEDQAGNIETSGIMKYSVTFGVADITDVSPSSGSSTSNASQIVTFTTTRSADCKYDPDYTNYSEMRYNMTDSVDTHTADLSLVFTIDKQYLLNVKCNNSANTTITPFQYITNLDTRSSYSIVRPSTWSALGDYFTSGQWNSFELPLWLLQNTSSLSSNYSRANVLTSVASNYTAFYGYNGTDWLSYVPGAVTNSFTEFKYNGVGQAYYINVNASDERVEIT